MSDKLGRCSLRKDCSRFGTGPDAGAMTFVGRLRQAWQMKAPVRMDTRFAHNKGSR